MIAEVIATYGRHLLLQDAAGMRHRARPVGRRLEIVCGDQAEYEEQGGEVLVTRILPRKTFLRRSNLRGRSEPLAANLSQLAVVVAPVPAPDPFMIDRYVCAAECAGLAALIVLNKSDLAQVAAAQALLAPLQREGYRLVAVSALDGHGIAPLLDCLRAHTTLFVGQSGVGKSSLTRLLTSDAADIAISALLRDEEGRHTTTASRLYECEGGGRIMDSPGVRDFAPAIDDLEPATLGFREVARLAQSCRFLDCLHLHEPGCAVRTAAQQGDMDPRRYESYRRLRRLYEQLWEHRPAAERAARRR